MCPGCVARVMARAEKRDAADDPGRPGNIRDRGIAARDGSRALLRKRASGSGWGSNIHRPRDRCRGPSRFERAYASFRHQRGIRFCNIRDLTSHFSFAGAKLCAPGDNADRNGVVSPRSDYGPPAGCAGTGLATDRGMAVGWEAW
ncbi:hypothetical protein GCM10023161_03640 [Mycobacterium paraffinicum]|uniref:Uncharacterized protein n=1 Tax=Mycobacterium paraffinicum TaxID=53378 RepID=A0ABP8RAN2_9MYCO